MPLTRISMRAGKPAAYRRAIFDGVYEAMRETFNVPENDRFMTISEHDSGDFDFGADYLGIARTDDFIIVQITANNTRTLDQKKALYAAIVAKLKASPGIRAGGRADQSGRSAEGELVVRQRHRAVRLSARVPAATPLRRSPSIGRDFRAKLRPGETGMDQAPQEPTAAIGHPPGASREAIRQHYDLSTEFFRLWLGRELVYSAALFEGDDDLEAAQARKLDHHIDAAGARGAARVLDIGCGWGALLRRLVLEAGVRERSGSRSAPSRRSGSATRRSRGSRCARRAGANIAPRRPTTPSSPSGRSSISPGPACRRTRSSPRIASFLPSATGR